MAWKVVLSSFLVCAACAPTRPNSQVSRSRQPRSGWVGGAAATEDELHQTSWRWVEAFCADGFLDLSRKGFFQHLQITSTGGGLRLLTDERLPGRQPCVGTVLTFLR